MNFKAENDIWMRRNGDVYEYIASYVDDLCIVVKQPSRIIDKLVNHYKYKLKGSGPIKFHLGCDFFHDKNGTLNFAPKKYLSKMLDNYSTMFGSQPRQCTLPLEKGDHPELDTSDELDEDGIKKYQSLIGALQRAVTLGCFDIMTAVMTLSSFHVSPRQGHMDRVK